MATSSDADTPMKDGRAGPARMLTIEGYMPLANTIEKHENDVLVSPTTVGCLAGASHRWIVGTPISRYTRPHNRGDLVEVTHQRCRKCGAERLNYCVIMGERLVAYI